MLQKQDQEQTSCRYYSAESRALPDRLKLEKRKNRKAAAERYEPIKGHFPGADYPLAVAQIDHTPMDVIVVDEEHRQPIQRPFLTAVIDVFSSMVLGFAIYLEKPSAFTAGLPISHAVCKRLTNPTYRFGADFAQVGG